MSTSVNLALSLNRLLNLNRLLPPTDFAAWTFFDVANVMPRDADAETNAQFYQGDHWQSGDGWAGPHVGPSADAPDVMAEVARGFVSVNAIAEVIDRHRDAVIGHPVMWHVAPRRFLKPKEEPTEGERTTIRLIEASLTRWWDEKQLMHVLRTALTDLLWASRTVMRVYVPPDLLTEQVDADGNVTATGVRIQVKDQTLALDTALAMCFPDAINPFQGCVYTHPVSRAQVGLLLFLDPAIGVQVAEMVYRDRESGALMYRKLGFTGTSDPESPPVPVMVPYGFPMVEATLPSAFISQQVRENQRALNLAATMIPRNVITSGFLERTILNAQMPGDWELDANGQKTRFVPKPYTIGAGSTSWLAGISYQDAHGATHVTSPSIDYREPIDPKASILAAAAHYGNILSATRQEYVLTNTEALMSGKSREQARAGFEASTRPTKTAAEDLIPKVMEAALGLAESFLGTPGLYTKSFRIVATARVDTGPAAADEREQDLLLVAAGAMAIETAQERAGIVDVDAENSRIAANPTYQLKLWADRFKALTDAVTAQIPIDVAVRVLHLPPEDERILLGAIEEMMTQQAEMEQAQIEALAKQPAKPSPAAKPPAAAATAK